MRLGPYEIVSLLAVAVHGARDVRLGRQVAIKLVLDDFLAYQTGRSCSSRRRRPAATGTETNVRLIANWKDGGR